MVVFVFFFKQKTAYEMRISDWSSDVCSSDLGMREGHRGLLTTITDLTGTGARAVGTHMAVLDNGDCAGSFSSGCVEAAIIAEAIEVFSESRPDRKSTRLNSSH